MLYFLTWQPHQTNVLHSIGTVIQLFILQGQKKQAKFPETPSGDVGPKTTPNNPEDLSVVMTLDFSQTILH